MHAWRAARARNSPSRQAQHRAAVKSRRRGVRCEIVVDHLDRDALVLRVDNVTLIISELAEKVMVRCVGGGQSRAARVEGARRAPFETMPAGIDAARPEPESESVISA